jgi:hypothetical protein
VAKGIETRLEKLEKAAEAPLRAWVRLMSEEQLLALIVWDLRLPIPSAPSRRPEAVALFGEDEVRRVEALPDEELLRIVGQPPIGEG